MAKFKKNKSGDLPAISTASLPDIVFMLLFFFMVATVMRDNTLMVQNTLPAADQVQKLDKKDRVNTYMQANHPVDTSIPTEPLRKFNLMISSVLLKRSELLYLQKELQRDRNFKMSSQLL